MRDFDIYAFERNVNKRVYLLARFFVLHAVRMAGIITGKGIPS